MFGPVEPSAEPERSRCSIRLIMM